MDLDRWAERIYSERDFGRSIATSISVAIGLCIYIIADNWVIAAFAWVIGFPVLRLATSAAYSSYRVRRLSESRQRRIQDLYDKLSDVEKAVLREFVKQGGCVMSWSHANRVNLPEPGVSSLKQRGILFDTVSADGMREAFGVTVEIFDVAQKAYSEEGHF